MSDYIQEELRDLLNIHDIDEEDMNEIEKQQNQLSRHDLKQTEKIEAHHAFHNWMILPESKKLMIYGDFSGPMLETSALSLFCTRVAREIRSRQECLCLVWFCGRHLGQGESNYDWSDDLGGYGRPTREAMLKLMMRSLIAQLLSDHEFSQRQLLPPGADMFSMRRHSLWHLRNLFRWLVWQLPDEITLFCLIDGAVFYEREEFDAPMFDILGDILGLIARNNTPTRVKLLVTSPRPTSRIRAAFEYRNIGPGEANDLMLSLNSLAL